MVIICSDWKNTVKNIDLGMKEKHVLGRDLSGVVVKKGSSVGDQFKVGDLVVGYTQLMKPGAWFAGK